LSWKKLCWSHKNYTWRNIVEIGNLFSYTSCLRKLSWIVWSLKLYTKFMFNRLINFVASILYTARFQRI